MDKHTEENYRKAGKIAAEAREASKSIVKVGKRLVDIAEEIESFVRSRGGIPAFPVNISINDIAAHYTPTKNDESSVKDGDVVKIDVGVHSDGYIGDTAVTVNFNKNHADIVKAAESALDAALKIARPDALLSEVSAVIEETIEGFGLKPVSNLTGHGLGKYDLHTEPTVPNVSFKSSYRLIEGQVIAIEPFATDGAGYIKDSESAFIFSLVDKKPVRNQDARKIIEFAESINGMPFAERWLRIDSLFKIRLAMKELRERGLLHEFNVLKEVRSGIVAQAEHTIIVRDPPVILTK